jgi:hypothetical protein
LNYHRNKTSKNYRLCIQCGKRSDNNKYCSSECYKLHRPPRKEKYNIIHKCIKCGAPSGTKSYCPPCKQIKLDSKPPKITHTCIRCNNTFTDVSHGRQYCSASCTLDLYDLDESYFSDEFLTPSKLFTLGQIISVGYIDDYYTIKMYSDEATLTQIANSLSTNYPIRKFRQKYLLLLRSEKMVGDLIRLGLSSNVMYQEFPPCDINGVLATDRLKVFEDGVHVYRTESIKLAMGLSDVLGGRIYTQTYSDKYKSGSMAIEYVLVF